MLSICEALVNSQYDTYARIENCVGNPVNTCLGAGDLGSYCLVFEGLQTEQFMKKYLKYVFKPKQKEPGECSREGGIISPPPPPENCSQQGSAQMLLAAG